MENLIKWFTENSNCLQIFSESKQKKAAIITNMLKAEIANEIAIQKEHVIDMITNEKIVNLINFLSENEKILVTNIPEFEYEGKLIKVDEMIATPYNFMELIKNSDSTFFIYQIKANHIPSEEIIIRYGIYNKKNDNSSN